MAGKPIFDPSQIENELNINWGGSDQGDPRKWDTNHLTFYFPTASDNILIDGQHDEINGEQPLTATEVNFVIDAITEWADIANITFGEVDNPDDADITIAYSSTTENGGTYASADTATFNDSEIKKENVWFSTDASGFHDLQDTNISFTDYGYITMLHELGHALGLSHPGEYNAGDANLTYANDAEFAQDNRQYTIMSYFGYEYQDTDPTTGVTTAG